MKTRIKEVVLGGGWRYFYPQYRFLWIWRNFRCPYFGHAQFDGSLEEARQTLAKHLEEIEKTNKRMMDNKTVAVRIHY